MVLIRHILFSPRHPLGNCAVLSDYFTSKAVFATLHSH
jgi:hypothetical protein